MKDTYNILIDKLMLGRKENKIYFTKEKEKENPNSLFYIITQRFQQAKKDNETEQ